MFLQNCLRVLGYLKISNFGYPVPEITDNAVVQAMDALYFAIVPTTG